MLKGFRLDDQELGNDQWTSFCAQMELDHGAALTRSFLWHLEASARYVPDGHCTFVPEDCDTVYVMMSDPNSVEYLSRDTRVMISLNHNINARRHTIIAKGPSAVNTITFNRNW